MINRALRSSSSGGVDHKICNSISECSSSSFLATEPAKIMASTFGFSYKSLTSLSLSLLIPFHFPKIAVIPIFHLSISILQLALPCQIPT